MLPSKYHWFTMNCLLRGATLRAAEWHQRYAVTKDMTYLHLYNQWRQHAIDLLRDLEDAAGVPHRPKRLLKPRLRDHS